MFSIYIIFN